MTSWGTSPRPRRPPTARQNTTTWHTTLALVLVACGCQRATPSPTPPVSVDVPRVTDATQAAAVDAGPPSAVSPRLVAFGSADAVRTWINTYGTDGLRRGGSANSSAIGGGFGLGGGGAGEASIGLGSVGTLGAGAGTGSGQGYGSGAGAAPSAAARSSAPRPPSPAPAGPGARVGGADSITNNQVEGVDEGTS